MCFSTHHFPENLDFVPNVANPWQYPALIFSALCGRAIKGLAPVCKVNPSLIAYGTFKDCMCAVKVLPAFADDIARSDFAQVTLPSVVSFR
ncbi:unnamed protein product [Gongylonema pulchrum]|uniref:Wax2_C domain-containing protein n=1 Tax=Gongylonema pulchrum TaxID=637853 RepID=A0A183DM62_9BILA|nr:unnamed protein product [Gongylonema pulchrum]